MADSFDSLRFFSWDTGEIRTLSHADCAFGYRDSVFKGALKGKGVILSVTFKLSTQHHALKTSYGAIQDELAARGQEASIQTISEAVIAIRQSKLPDPKVLGNSGSFFKNPVVSAEKAEQLRSLDSETPLYAQSDGSFKVAAGWLIDRLKLKGFKKGKAAVHDKQALVLVNTGGASGKEIFDLSAHIKQRVVETYGVELEEEVTIY